MTFFVYIRKDKGASTGGVKTNFLLKNKPYIRMKTIAVGMFIIIGLSSFSYLISERAYKINQTIEQPPKKLQMKHTSFYEIKIKNINGSDLKLSDYKGKKILIVNVASECGYTPQYEQLEKLYKENFGNLVIIGCPSNDFGGQEPGSNDQIVTFCKKNYGVTFPLTEKMGITNNTHSLYQWLTKKENNGVSDNEVKWNFTKFLIDENGHLIKCLPSAVSPMDEQIIKWINL